MEFHLFDQEFLPSSLIGIKPKKVVDNRFILTGKYNKYSRLAPTSAIDKLAFVYSFLFI